MKLYIGGAWQGQSELAHTENPTQQVFDDFHETIREAVKNGEAPREFASAFCEKYPNAIVVSNEVGAGVVPIAKEDRAFRESVGRALCVIAQHAESVIRVVCGIGVRIK